MRKKLAKTLLLSTALCLALGVGTLTACKNTESKLEGLTLNVTASEDVEIGSNYLISKNKAVDAEGNEYVPEVKVYCGDEDITSTMMDVFFSINSFEEYRVEYIIKAGKEEKVFTTELNVVDTTKPTITAQALPETMQFDSTFALNKDLFVITDNSGETLTPTFTVVQTNGTKETVLECNDAGEYVFDSEYVTSVNINVKATDSNGNVAEENYIIENEDGEVINLVKDGEYATLWSQPQAIVYSFAKETVDGAESDVLTISADMSNIPSGEALNVVIKLDKEYDLPGSLEFDIMTENMLDWFSIIPYNGINKGLETGYNESSNGSWHHRKCSYDDSIGTIDSIILHIQPTTNAWWQEDPIDYYDETKLTVIKLANFTFTEEGSQIIPPPEVIPEHTLVDTNAEYALNSVAVRMDRHTLEYNTEVKYGDEAGSLKIESTEAGDGYFVITNPLIKDISSYDYIEFKMYNASENSIYVCVAWVQGVSLAPGDWTTMRVNVEDFASGDIVDPWTSATYSATDVSGLSFYMQGSTMKVGNVIYLSSIKAVKEDLSAIDCGKDTYMELIKKATPDTFAEYCTKLSTAGYEKISERTAADNMFATFVNANEYKYVYYTSYNKQIRVMTGPIASLLREDYSITVDETVTPYIATIPQPNDGEGFIFRLPDGRFIIQDGGYAGEDRVYEAFKQLVGDGKIVIAAWFISHPHADHYPALLDFVKDHGTDENITIERVIYNYGHEEMFNAAGSTGDGSSESVNRLYDGLATYAPNVPLLKAHTGQLINFGSATVEILYTMEDLIPTIMTNVNDSSMVIRLTLANNTITLLNDTCYANGPMLSELWGEYLKSDMVQVAHHGMWPSVESIYHDIAAEVLLMTTMRSNLQYYLVDERWADVYEAFLSYAKDMHVCGDEVIVIELPYVIQNNLEETINDILGGDDDDIIPPPDVIPEHTLVDTNAEYALNSIIAKGNSGGFKVSYSTDVKYGDELGSVKITCSTSGDGYFVISNPLIKDISAYDYIEFQVYNASERGIYIAVAWIAGVTVQPGQWATIRVNVSSYNEGDITDPWNGATINATDASATAFYIKNTQTADVFYISSIKAVKEGMEQPDKPTDAPENAIVYTGGEYAVNSVTMRGQSADVTTAIEYSTEVKYEGEAGSLQLTATATGARYLILSNPLLKDISAYDYLEFHVYNASTGSVYVAVAWVSGVTIPAGEWGTIRVTKESFEANKVSDPWTSVKYGMADVTGVSFYITNMDEGESIYVSSILAVKEAVEEPEHTCNFATLTSDETQHWYVCECGEISEKESHKGGTATTTEQAKCEVCDTAYGELAQPEEPVEAPENAIVFTGSSDAVNRVEMGQENHTVEYSTDVKYEGEVGSLKITATNSSADYLVLSNPLLKDISAYDYLEFHIYNAGTGSVYVCVAWLSGVTIQPGQWGTLRVTASAFNDGDVSDPWTSAVYSMTDITNVAFYIRDMDANESIYVSSILAMKETVIADAELELINHLKFDENVTDELGGNTVANGELTYVDGISGKAVVLNNGYISLNFAPGTSSYSVAFWLKTSSISGDPAFFANKDWDDGNNLGFTFLVKNGNEIAFNFAADGVRKDVSTTLPANFKTEWTHVVIVVDRSAKEVRVAFNFEEFVVLSIEELGRDSSLNGLDGVNIGQDGTGEYGCDFTATMDEFKLWKGALTQANVDELKEQYKELMPEEPEEPIDAPENAIVYTGGEYAVNSINVRGGASSVTTTIEYSTEVKYENEAGSVKLTATATGDRYLIISNPLLKDISAYDYLEFHVYNASTGSVYVAAAWVSGVTIPAGEWGTIRITKESFEANDISDPWTSEEYAMTDITNVAFYIKSMDEGESIYVSSILAVKEPIPAPENAIVFTANADSVNSINVKGGASSVTTTIEHSTEVKYEGEVGSLKLTATATGDRYLILSNPILKDISAYDYLEFHVYNASTGSVYVAAAWVSGVTIPAGEWGTIRITKESFEANDISDPWTSEEYAMTDITGVSFYIKSMDEGESIYVSSILAVKEAVEESETTATEA